MNMEDVKQSLISDLEKVNDLKELNDLDLLNKELYKSLKLYSVKLENL